MNLNFLGLSGGTRQAAKETNSQAAGSDYSKNIQNLTAVRNLRPGQIISGMVTSVDGGEIQIALNQDQYLTARMEQQMELALGKMMSFEVRSNGMNQLSLRPLYANLAQNPAALNALDEAGLPYNEQTGEMVTSLMQEGMPIDRQTLLSVYRQIQANPQAAARTIVLMNSLGLPVTPEGIAQFEKYQNNEHQLLNESQKLGEELPRLFSQVLKDDGAQMLLEINRQFLDIFAGEEAAGPAEQSGGKIVYAEDGQVLAKGGEAGEPGTAGMKGDMGDGGAVLSPGPEGTPSKEGEGGPEAGRELPLSRSERMQLANQLRALQLNEEQAARIESGKVSAREALSMIGHLLKDHGPSGSKELNQLLMGKEYQSLLREEVTRQWLLEPRDVADKGKVEDLYRRLDGQTAKVMQMLENLGKSDSGLMRAAQGLKENVNFLNQLNQVFTYVQLPLKMRRENAHGDLYVYTNKKNLAAKDGNISALLHLDMERLGSMDVYVAMRDGNKINTHFYLEREELIDLIEKNIHLLNERLEKRGYSMSTIVTGKEKETERPAGGLFAEEVKDRRPAQQFSFDVRA